MNIFHWYQQERSVMKYRIIRTIITEGSLPKAADKLNMTQTAVRHAVNSLENMIAFPIFNRLKTGIQLTQEGSQLLP
jgi:DNA-binding transcriptional LysR family regulator